MGSGKDVFSTSDLPWAAGAAAFFALAVYSNYALASYQPTAFGATCGAVIAGFAMVLGWIRARNRITWAKKAPKVTARKVPKQ